MLGVCGCGPTPEEEAQNAAYWRAVAAQERANDEARCKRYGFQIGTQGYAQCLMSLDQQRRAIDDANRDAMGRMLLNRQMSPNPIFR